MVGKGLDDGDDDDDDDDDGVVHNLHTSNFDNTDNDIAQLLYTNRYHNKRCDRQ